MDRVEQALMVSLQVRNRQLEDRVEELEIANADLRKEIGHDLELPAWLPHLSKNEGVIMRLLLRRNVVTHRMAMIALYGDSEWPDDKLPVVYISKIRAKLRPHKLKITTVWAQGWTLDSATRKRMAIGTAEAKTHA